MFWRHACKSSSFWCISRSRGTLTPPLGFCARRTELSMIPPCKQRTGFLSPQAARWLHWESASRSVAEVAAQCASSHTLCAVY